MRTVDDDYSDDELRARTEGRMRRLGIPQGTGLDGIGDELDARRRVLAGIDDEGDRAAVLAVFARVDWRRHLEAIDREIEPELAADMLRALGYTVEPPTP